MTDFHYQALNAEQELVEGRLQADNVKQAIEQLEADGLTVRLIGIASIELPSDSIRAMSADHAAAKDGPADDGGSFGTASEQEVLRSHMGRVMELAEALVPALRAYADEMSPGRRRRQLLAVVRVLERGDVAEATAAMGKLPDCWIPLLSAAATSHDPGRVLRDFLDESQQVDELRRQWWLTPAYSVFIAATAAIVLTALSFFVIPAFREIFADFGTKLHPLTELVLTLGEWIISGRILIGVAVFLVIGVLLLNVHRLLPSSLSETFGSPFGRRTALARFARFTADLLDAGLDIPAALRIAGFVSRRPNLRRAAWRLAREMTTDGGSGHPSGCHPLTMSVLHALHADMPIASRIRLLREIGICHTERVRIQLSWVRGIVEPVTIIVVGLIVGVVVVGLFLPLIKLITDLA